MCNSITVHFSVVKDFRLKFLAIVGNLFWSFNLQRVVISVAHHRETHRFSVKEATWPNLKYN